MGNHTVLYLNKTAGTEIFFELGRDLIIERVDGKLGHSE
jgi:hypothetical protein